MRDNKYHRLDKKIGEQVRTSLVNDGVLSYQAVCSSCGGCGHLPDRQPCTHCDGHGHYLLAV